MNAGSLFSGIGGLDEGLRRAGFAHAFFCESDGYRRDVLRARFPGVPVYEDVRDVAAECEPLAGSVMGQRNGRPAHGDGQPVDLLCGGFPCQDLSVAGRRKGLAGERSSLFFEFARIADALRPRWLLVENVPGLLSSNGGRDFGVVLGTLADIGYGVGWRVLDSRFFGVPQRRRRVFIVGARADGDPSAAAERAGEVLAVGEGCDRHSKTGGEAWEDAPVASLSGLGTGGPDDNDAQGGRLIAPALVRRYGKGTDSDATDAMVISHTLTSEGHDASEDGTGRGTPLVAVRLSHGSNPNSNMAGRRREDDFNLVAETVRSHPRPGSNSNGNIVSFDAKMSNQGAPDDQAILTRKLRRAISSEATGVRRLTPVECERLQALPDGWTDLGGTPDSRRYAALGDAVTASVAEWIGRRLLAVAP